MPTIQLKTEIRASKEVVFDLSRSVDLHRLSTAQTNETVVDGKSSGLLELGETVTWRAKHLGFYQTLTSKITVFQYPDYFEDEMVQGIFKSFRHKHHFTQRNGTTTMVDIFNYTSPFGFIGRLADILFLKKYMTNFLRKRNATIKEFAENGRYAEILNDQN
jgi:ligand-binding SRPBCC domain-containing protein